MSKSLIPSIAAAVCMAVVVYVGCSSNSTVSTQPTQPPRVSPTPTITSTSTPLSKSTTMAIPSSATTLPIPAIGGFSGTFVFPNVGASPGANLGTLTLTSYAGAPAGAPAPQAIARIPSRWAAHARRLATGPTAIFWVSQQYSAALSIPGFPATAWQVPTSDISPPLALETFDGTTNTLLDTEFDTNVSGNTVTFPGSAATFGVLTGHTYWWELLSGKAPSLQITSGNPPAGQVGAPYNGGSFGLSASGGQTPYTWSWSASSGSSLPPGLSIQAAGAIVGTPTKAGTFNVIVTVSDSEAPVQHASANYSITIAAAPPLVITSGTPPPGEVGVQYDFGGFNLNASGGVTPYSWSWKPATGSALPPGLSIQVAGIISGTPTAGGTYHVVVTVTDAGSPVQHTSATYTITIVSAPPTLSANEYLIPTASSGTGDIASGPDNNLWFTETAARNIGRLTTSGVFAEFADSGGSPFAIAVGPDGNLWFSNGGFPFNSSDQVGQITPSGTVSQFSLGCCHGITGVAAGADGNLWLADDREVGCGKRCHRFSSDIDVMTVSGTLSHEYLTHCARLARIIVGPDGNLWFVEPSCNNIGRITTAGVITEFPVPTASSGLSGYLTRGPDGNIWFTEGGANKIGRITPSGSIAEFPIPSPLSGAAGIAAGPDGNVWFTENSTNNVGKITPTGTITEFRIPTAASAPAGITKGPDGDVWFVENGANKIAKFNPLSPARFSRLR